MSKQSMALTVLNQLDSCYLECDGLTTVISSILSAAGIPHTVYIGGVIDHFTGQGMSPHLWIKVGENTFLDYRLRMWLGHRPEIPHGIFNLAEYSHIEYIGQERDCVAANNPIAQILCQSAGIDYEDIVKRLKEKVDEPVQ